MSPPTTPRRMNKSYYQHPLEMERTKLFEAFTKALDKARDTKAGVDLERVESTFNKLKQCTERLLSREERRRDAAVVQIGPPEVDE
eukprot:CAMPEP_0119005356 /NCGR_PEP_ID=MMETSP1176-20130426/1666_1 /TAXON_ID=265551 /ORGANISM="Synedropsis recta cf, Strain CCMP1620" /LENGTH=85 /DNA_ID=CAMNT_0006957145 /DNA_START=118 /DNA_END=375 /DNA_ORIENTATION=+